MKAGQEFHRVCNCSTGSVEFYNFMLIFLLRYGIPACWPRGTWNGPFVGHHAECSGSMDASTSFINIRGPKEWMPMIQKNRRTKSKRSISGPFRKGLKINVSMVRITKE